MVGFAIAVSATLLKPVSALADYVSKKDAFACVEQYYDSATFYGTLEGEDGKVLWQFDAGSYIVTTNYRGTEILSIVLKPEIESVFQCSGERKTEDELIQSAHSELHKYIDIKYDLADTVCQNEGSDLVHIEMFEMRDGLETGAGGYAVYYADGTLFSCSFTKRVIDDPKSESIISEDAAVDIAKGAIEQQNPDIEQVILTDDGENSSVVLRTVQIGQIYQIQMQGKLAGRDVYMTVIVHAKDGSIYEIYDTEH